MEKTKDPKKEEEEEIQLNPSQPNVSKPNES
jgi:hypothetical protein